MSEVTVTISPTVSREQKVLSGKKYEAGEYRHYHLGANLMQAVMEHLGDLWTTIIARTI